MFAKYFDWYYYKNELDSADISETRDVFQARLDALLRNLLRNKIPEEDAYLITAVIGEMGNNCFDHKQGIFKTLSHVRPDLKNHQEALQLAFEKKISGRFPEKRGNGLKFVRQVLNGNPSRGLFVSSGDATSNFGGDHFNPLESMSNTSNGVLAFLRWRIS